MVDDTLAPDSMQQVLANQQVTLLFTTSYRTVRVPVCVCECGE